LNVQQLNTSMNECQQKNDTKRVFMRSSYSRKLSYHPSALAAARHRRITACLHKGFNYMK
jgi:hypothetical protein